MAQDFGEAFEVQELQELVKEFLLGTTGKSG